VLPNPVDPNLGPGIPSMLVTRRHIISHSDYITLPGVVSHWVRSTLYKSAPLSRTIIGAFIFCQVEQITG